jgi:hypothetical protein
LVAASVAILCAALATSASAQSLPNPATPLETVGALLNISPRRVTFDASSKSAAVVLSDPGSGTTLEAGTTFVVTLVDRVMLPDGRILPADEVLQDTQRRAFGERMRSGRAVLTAMPEEVVVRRGEQARVQVRLSGESRLPAGEYRTHLTFTAKDPSPPPASGSGTRIVFAHSIPVIVRIGPIDVRAKIENARMEYGDRPDYPNTPLQRSRILVFDLVREGENSLFGNVEVRAVSTSKREALGALLGVGVYPEVERRTVVVPLVREPKLDELLAITFTDADTLPGEVLATFELHVVQPTMVARND